MVHFIDKVLENLRPYVPLMQTLVWPIVVLIAIWLFRAQVRACIEAIRKRIEAGGGIKAGPFEIPAMSPATPQEQARKLENETAEETGELGVPVPQHLAPSGNHRDFMASIVLAEDLVMKKLSAELNLKILRQVRAERGTRFIFDGVSVDESKFVAIEVKLIRRGAPAGAFLRQSLDRLNTYYTSLAEEARRKFSLILAVVIEEGNPEDVIRGLSFIRETYHFPVHIVCYRFKELQAEFGIK
jgi:hypothetical protein